LRVIPLKPTNKIHRLITQPTTTNILLEHALMVLCFILTTNNKKKLERSDIEIRSYNFKKKKMWLRDEGLRQEIKREK
jgi:hypothetical protein